MPDTSQEAVTYRAAWKEFVANKSAAVENLPGPLRVGLISSFTIDGFIPHLGGALLQCGFEYPQITVGPQDQVFQSCLKPSAAFSNIEQDLIVLTFRIEDLFPSLVESVFMGEPGSKATLREELTGFLDCVRMLRQATSGTLIVSVPGVPSLPWFDLDQPGATALRTYFSDLLTRWAIDIEELDGVLAVSLAAIVSATGKVAALDDRKWYLYRQPYSVAFWDRLACQVCRQLVAATRASKKCIVVDCDNTLWGGIVGEDGLAGIQLGETFPGRAFLDFQRHLRYLKEHGIFVCIASKNNEADVFEVFDSHDAMVLRRDDVAVFQVHWRSKVDSILDIAKQLNIGLDSFVFVDDNPKEIAEVCERLPEVECLIVPEELAELPSLLPSSMLFDRREITAEDKKRTEMVKAESRRQSHRGELTEADFLASLELDITVFEVDSRHVSRATQLINKSNQFNLTTRRRTQEELLDLLGQQSVMVLALDVSDRFGDYGLVGVAIVELEKENNWILDTFLMSCRVLGRGVETSFIHHVLNAVGIRGGAQLLAQYFPTTKNELIKGFLEDHGFREVPDSDFLGRPVCEPPEVPVYVSSSLEI